MAHPAKVIVPRFPRIIVLDGPEAAGKTTLAEAIVIEAESRGIKTRLRHWGQLEHSWTADAVYAEALEYDLTGPGQYGLCVWDRSWASEAVYGKVLKRERRLANDWWLGEWLYGRAAQMCGKRVMVLGPDASTLAARRFARNDPTDLVVSEAHERAMFQQYAKQFGWTYTTDIPNTQLLVNTLLTNGDAYSGPDPRDVCGDPAGRIVVLGEKPSNGPPPPGAWLPFSSRLTEKYGRALGDNALMCTWTNVSVDPIDLVSDAKLVIACGHEAAKYVERHRDEDSRVYVPHPAALYRWGYYTDEVRQNVEEIMAQRVQEAMLAPR